jgi:hypothetical protein
MCWYSRSIERGQPRGNPGILKWDRELLRLQRASVIYGGKQLTELILQTVNASFEHCHVSDILKIYIKNKY